MSQKYDEQDEILFDTILRQPAELYLSVYSIVITFVASGTCLTHSNCLLQHFPFDPKFSPRGETVGIFKEPEYLKNQAQEFAADKGPHAWKVSRHLHEFFGKMNY